MFYRMTMSTDYVSHPIKNSRKRETHTMNHRSLVAYLFFSKIVIFNVIALSWRQIYTIQKYYFTYATSQTTKAQRDSRSGNVWRGDSTVSILDFNRHFFHDTGLDCVTQRVINSAFVLIFLVLIHFKMYYLHSIRINNNRRWFTIDPIDSLLQIRYTCMSWLWCRGQRLRASLYLQNAKIRADMYTILSISLQNCSSLKPLATDWNDTTFK